MKRINVAILGCGRLGRRHAETYKKHPNVNIKGFYDIQNILAKKISLEYHANQYDSIKSIINDSEVDALSICVPNALHFKILEKAIKVGKHILVEKPIVTTLEHCNKIIQLMKKSSSKIMVGHIHRFFTCNIALKSILDSDKIGTPLIINTFDYIPGRIPGQNIPLWVFRRKTSGGGVFMTDLVHTVDKISWLINSPIRKVFTPTISRFITNSEVENVGTAILWFANGCIASCTHGCPSPGYADMSTKIIGDKGEISLKFASDLEINKSSNSSINYKYKGNYLKQMNLAFHTEIDKFVKSVLKNQEPVVNYKEGVKAVQVILALYESFRKKRPITLKN